MLRRAVRDVLAGIVTEARGGGGVVGVARSLARRHLPAPVVDGLRRGRRVYRRARWRWEVARGLKPTVTKERLIEDLGRLGVRPGMDVIVHGALSKIGKVEGGPKTVVEALLELLGPEGTLLMPVYSMKGTMLETMEDPTPFDVRRSPSVMGAMTEVFRTMPGVRRSAHPTHSVAAYGPRAEYYTADHHRSGSPCGPGSPFARLSERGGYVLVLGSGIGKVTSHHTIEDQLEDFPLDVYVPGTYRKEVIFEDGHSEEVEVRVHSPELGKVRIDANPEKEREIHDHMRRRGIVTDGKVGVADSHLFRTTDLDALLRDLAAEGVTIYGV